MRVKLATVNLQASQPERSKRFYVDVLGMAEDPRRSHSPGFVYLRSEGCDLTIATPEIATGSQPSATIELGFEVDDIAALRAHLAACGVRDYREQSMGWGRAVELRDADGYRVLIYSFQREDQPVGG